MVRSFTWKRSRAVSLLLLAAPVFLFGQAANEFTGTPGQTTPLTVKITNSCKETESFNVHVSPSVPWVSLPTPSSIDVGPGGSQNFTFNLAPASDMAGGTYNTTVSINCLKCADETPPCKQSDSKFPISLIIPKTNDGSGGGAAGGSGGKKTGTGSPFNITPNPGQAPKQGSSATNPTTPGGNPPNSAAPTGGTPTANPPNAAPATGSSSSSSGSTPQGPSSTGAAQTAPPTELTPATPSGTSSASDTTPTPTAPSPVSLPAVLGGLISALGAATLLLGSGSSLVKDILQAAGGASSVATPPSASTISTTPATTTASTATSSGTDGAAPATTTATTTTPTDPSDVPVLKDPSDLPKDPQAGGMWDAALQSGAQEAMAAASGNAPGVVQATTPASIGQISTTPATIQTATTTTSRAPLAAPIAYAPSTPQDPSDIDVGKDPSDLPKDPQVGGMWDAELETPAQAGLASAAPATGSSVAPGSVAYTQPILQSVSDPLLTDPSDRPKDPVAGGMWDASLLQDSSTPKIAPPAGALTSSIPGLGDYYNPSTGERGNSPGDGWIRLGPTPPMPGIPRGAMVSWEPGKEPRLFVNPKTGELTWVFFGEDAPYGWMPLTNSPFYPFAPEGAGDYYDPKTGEMMHANYNQPVPVGWKKMNNINPLSSTTPGEEPQRYVDPKTGNNQWVRPGEDPPAGWIPVKPAFGSTSTPSQSEQPTPGAGGVLRDEQQSAGGLSGQLGQGGDSGGNQKPAASPATQPPAAPQQPSTPSEPRQPQQLDGGNWRPSVTDPPPKPPNYGPGGILNQPLGEDPPPTKPNYGPGGILNQPLGEDPKPPQQLDGGDWRPRVRPDLDNPPTKPPNYGPGGILNQPLGEDPPPAKPNYGPGGILNQPLGEDPPKAPAPTAVAEPKPGDLNAGGGHTFSRGTTKEDLEKANRPPTKEEMDAAKTTPGGDDEVGKRWIKTNEGMKQIQKEADDDAERFYIPPVSVFEAPPPAPPRPPVPPTPEDIARNKFIDEQIKRAHDAHYKIGEKFWQDLKRDENSFSQGLKDAIDTLMQLLDLLNQAIANGEGPSLVDAYVAVLGHFSAKIPGIKQLGEAFLGLSDRDLSEYGLIARLKRSVEEQMHVIALYRSPGGATAVNKYLNDEAESIFYGAVPGMVAGGATAGASATSGAVLRGGPPGAPTGKARTPTAAEARAKLGVPQPGSGGPKGVVPLPEAPGGRVAVPGESVPGKVAVPGETAPGKVASPGEAPRAPAAPTENVPGSQVASPGDPPAVPSEPSGPSSTTPPSEAVTKPMPPSEAVTKPMPPSEAVTKPLPPSEAVTKPLPPSEAVTKPLPGNEGPARPFREAPTERMSGTDSGESGGARHDGTTEKITPKKEDSGPIKMPEPPNKGYEIKPDDMKPLTPEEAEAWRKSVDKAAKEPPPDPLGLLTPEERARWAKEGQEQLGKLERTKAGKEGQLRTAPTEKIGGTEPTEKIAKPANQGKGILPEPPNKGYQIKPEDMKPMTPEEAEAWRKSVDDAAKEPPPDPLGLLTDEERARWAKEGQEQLGKLKPTKSGNTPQVPVDPKGPTADLKPVDPKGPTADVKPPLPETKTRIVPPKAPLPETASRPAPPEQTGTPSEGQKPAESGTTDTSGSPGTQDSAANEGKPAANDEAKPAANDRKAKWRAIQEKAGAPPDIQKKYGGAIERARAKIPGGARGACEAAKEALLNDPDVKNAGHTEEWVGEGPNRFSHEVVVSEEGYILDPVAEQVIDRGLADEAKLDRLGLLSAVKKGIFTPEQWARFKALR